jgi:uncharacterized protein
LPQRTIGAGRADTASASLRAAVVFPLSPTHIRDRIVQFHLQSPDGVVVTGTGDGWIRVGVEEIRANVVLTPEAVIRGFAGNGFDALDEADFAALLVHRPEVVLLGTGAVQRFPHPRITRALPAARVGLEVMDTRAACRTFNILTAEGRRVVAALVVAG